MSNAAANNIDVDLFSRMQTPDSDVQNAAPTNVDPLEAAVRQCLHPPSSIPSFSGLPTNDVRSQVIAKYVDVGINKTPMIFDNGSGQTRLVTAADLTTFDYAFLVTNGARVSTIPFVYNSTQNILNQDLNNVGHNDIYDFNQFSTDATLYRIAAKSQTTVLNATAFNDTGMASGVQFNPNILFAGTLLAMSAKEPTIFFEFVHQMLKPALDSGAGRISKKHPDYPAALEAHNQFPVYIQQELRRKLSLREDEIPHMDPNVTIQLVSFGTMPTASIVPTPSAIMNQSTRAATNTAREGAYEPLRLNTIAPAWCAAGNTNTSDHGLYQCYYHFEYPAGVPHYSPFLDNQLPGTAAGALVTLVDTLWTKDTTWAWQYFQGLSMNSQTNTSFQLMMRKIYTIIEIQPAFQSPWAGMTRPAPMPNARAMQAIMDGFYGTKDCLPARYNFWGALLGAVAPSLLKVGESLIKHLTKSEDTGRTENIQQQPAPRRAPRAARPQRAAPQRRVPRRRAPPAMPLQQFQQMQLVPQLPPRQKRVRAPKTPSVVPVLSQPTLAPARRNRRRLPADSALYTHPIVRGNGN